jgi:hypothetical protein
VARRQARRLRHGAIVRLSGAAHQRAAPGLTPSARRAGPARRPCRQRSRDPGQRTRLLGVDRTARTASSAGLLANAATVTGGNGPPGEPGGDQVARSHKIDETRICPVHRLASAGSRRRASSPRPGKYPIRTHVRRPNRPPLLYFPAVLPCCTAAIRADGTSRGPRWSPDQGQPSKPGYRCVVWRAPGQAGPQQPAPRRSVQPFPRRDTAPHPGQAACGHRVLAWIRTDPPARKIRSTDTLARCGSRTPALSRSHDEHDHKNHDHDTTGHAGTNPITETVPEPSFRCGRQASRLRG